MFNFFPNWEKNLVTVMEAKENSAIDWVKWLRMQGHRLPAILEVKGSNLVPGKINLIKIEKNTNGIPDSKKVYLFTRKKRTFE
jgi:hypothetical protein